MRHLGWVLFCVLAAIMPGIAAEQVTADAAQWQGGPGRTGAVQGGPALAESWPQDGPPLLWHATLPASSSAGSIVVTGNRAYLTFTYFRKDDAAPKTGAQGKLLSVVYCLDCATGAVIWQHELGETWGGWIFPGGTPAVADGHVFVIYGPVAQALSNPERTSRTKTLAVCCLDAKTGAEIWHAEQADATTNLTMHGGPYTSPLLVNGVCVVQATGASAYDAATGKLLWQQACVDSAHASPAAWQAPDGKWCVLCRSGQLPTSDTKAPVVKPTDASGKPLAGGVIIDCLDLATGQPRWAVTAMGASMWNASMPVVAENTLLALDMNGNSAFRLGADLPQPGWTTAKEVNFRASPHYGPTPVVADGFVYTPMGFNGTKLLCERLATGEMVGTVELVKGAMSMIFASAAAADGKVIYCNVTGKAKDSNLFLLHGGADFRLLAQCTIPNLLEYPSPTVAEGKLYLRLRDGVACYDLRK